MNRRHFLKRSSSGILLLGTMGFPTQLFAGDSVIKLTILHTNDVHSRIDPFPMDGGKYQGLGGAAKRAALLKKIRAEEENVLLFDCGDMLQGTPYFNFYEGKLEFELMNEMRYDATTIGNHDFDAGIETLGRHLGNTNFVTLNTNYGLDNTPLNNKVQAYKVFEKAGLKIGVLGVGIELDGLVPAKLYGETQYSEPIQSANKTASILKKELKCDLVVCLSHLGYKYETNKVSDYVLAKQSQNIDVILGGHTHTFMEQPDIVQNKDGEEVLINQVGWAGIRLGRLDYYFVRGRKGKSHKKVQSESLEIH